ncbi:MAG TPA: YaiI/YqxD family protein [Syntrophomonas sp.]|nr:YaiI/YqxD family protein [Syntrophomonas sp.]
MKIIVDADACPVKQIIEKTAQKHNLAVIMVSNYHHQINSEYASVLVVDGASQAADLVIVNHTSPGDIIVTQDYGLAAMILGKQAYAIHPMGNIYTSENIEGLLMQRYVNQKARQAKKHVSGPRKRQTADDQRFEGELENLINLYEQSQ